MLKFPIWPASGEQQALAEGGCLLSSKRHRAPGTSILTGRQQLHQPLGGPHFPRSCRRHSRPAPVPRLPGERSASPTLRGSLTPGRSCGPGLCSRARCVHFRTQECACQRPAPGAPEVERAPASAATEGRGKNTRREGRVRPHRAGRRVPEATGGARIAGRAHRGPHSACRLTRPAPSGPHCHCPSRPSTGGQSVHPSMTLTGRPGDDEDRSLGRPAGLRSSNFRLPGAVASNNSPAEGTTAPARRG